MEIKIVLYADMKSIAFKRVCFNVPYLHYKPMFTPAVQVVGIG